MITENNSKSALSPYRVLDLTEGGCMLGGRMLGDLGADVIKIEPPGGSPSRIAPFYKDIRDPEKSLWWFAYNFNKRGVTLNITLPAGQELFKKLVASADIVLESFEPGYLGQLGLGYPDLAKIKPGIIMTSITLFGQSGPKAHYKGSDLTAWASGGYLNACGDPDRAPVWISFPQCELFGGADGAIGALTALWQRHKSGRGQHVDVSLQECAMSPTLNVLPMWGANKVDYKRLGINLFIPTTGVRETIYYRCRDGYVMILLMGGNEPFVSSSARMVKWMAEEGMAPEWLQKLDWATDYNAISLGQDLATRVAETVEKFTLTKTKAELYEIGAMKRNILIAPLSDTRDISQDVQLQFRGYWLKIAHPELKEALTYCGPFIRMSESPLKYRLRPPLIGEHNQEIYGREMGFSQEELRSLKQKEII
ncbi:MAG: CoA transferase [Chloroflexi bacterium]|nr:CoA transferase [Chloroflexota bacterium]